MWVSRIVFGALTLIMVGTGVAFMVSRSDDRQRVEYLSATPSDPAAVKIGQAARFSGEVAGDNGLTSAFSRQPCVASWTLLQAVSEEPDGEGGIDTEWETLINDKRGPTTLALEVRDWTVRVPLALWTKRRAGKRVKRMKTLPAELGLPAPKPTENVVGYDLHEVAFARGKPAFVAGLVAARDTKTKTITLGRDARLESPVELVPGAQDQLLRELSSKAGSAGRGALVMFAVGAFFLVLLFVFGRRG